MTMTSPTISLQVSDDLMRLYLFFKRIGAHDVSIDVSCSIKLLHDEIGVSYVPLVSLLRISHSLGTWYTVYLLTVTVNKNEYNDATPHQ